MIETNEDLVSRAAEWETKLRNCESQKHPYRREIMVPFSPRSNSVMMACTGCSYLYDRPPTKEEIKNYEDCLRLEITI